ncbi:MAG TPA: phosphotransferase [Kofleriaceae bacterium]|nr:phosphotransferase [Kofleriaceae bacterium]
MVATQLSSPAAPRLRDHVQRLYPGASVVSIEALGPDGGATAGATTKAAGYGMPVRIVISEGGVQRDLVWRVASANPYGHDRRSDRAAAMVQAFDDFANTPQHVQAVDLGVMGKNGELTSTRDATELYLITTYAHGTIYAQDLRRIAAERLATPIDVDKVDVLARYLAALHTPISPPGTRYRRAIRDLLGSGEGIFGIIDGYPEDVPGAPRERLREIEERCATWRWRLRDRDARLVRTHGDFHPFNIVFDGMAPTLLDASRGGCGDPADDVTALAINFLLFALDARASWGHGLGVLWRHLWHRYLAERPDEQLLEVAPPFLMWRALVVANPTFYPRMTARARDQLLGFATEVLDDHVLDPSWAEELFR